MLFVVLSAFCHGQPSVLLWTMGERRQKNKSLWTAKIIISKSKRELPTYNRSLNVRRFRRRKVCRFWTLILFPYRLSTMNCLNVIKSLSCYLIHSPLSYLLLTTPSPGHMYNIARWIENWKVVYCHTICIKSAKDYYFDIRM